MSEEQEYVDYLTNKLRNPTFFEKINKSIYLFFLKKSDVNNMRQEIIQNFKPVFIEYVNSSNKEDISQVLTINNFEKRIFSLPKDTIVDIYQDFQFMKSRKSENNRQRIRVNICHYILLSYSIDGWFRNILLHEIMKNR